MVFEWLFDNILYAPYKKSIPTPGGGMEKFLRVPYSTQNKFLKKNFKFPQKKKKATYMPI